MQNLKTLALIGAKISMTEIFIGERGKWTNKRNDNQEEADSLLHNTISHTQHLYHAQTHTITEKTKIIYHLYTSYAGGIIT